MWVNALIWELGLPVESILNEQTEERFTRRFNFNWIEQCRFRSFVAQATSLDRPFLECVPSGSGGQRDEGAIPVFGGTMTYREEEKISRSIGRLESQLKTDP
jgi:hypothetical protein